MTDILYPIIAPQADLIPQPAQPREHKALLLACIDARKRIEDLGFAGETLMLRNIGATAFDTQDKTPHTPEYDAAVADQRAAIKDAIDKGAREIFVMNHDHCGGIGCLCGAHLDHLGAVYEHLHQNRDLKGTPRDVGEEAVRRSVKNLEANPDVQAAGVKVHGTIVNTATGTLREMQEDGQFRLMAASAPGDSELMKKVRARQQGKEWSEEAPRHEPNMLLISEMSSPITSQVLDLHGHALVYRDHDPCAETLNIGQKAAVDFALKQMGVKDIAVMIPLEGDYADRSRGAPPEAQRKLRTGIRKLENYIADSLKLDGITLHPWVMDRSGRVCEMNVRDGSIAPLTERQGRVASAIGK